MESNRRWRMEVNKNIIKSLLMIIIVLIGLCFLYDINNNYKSDCEQRLNDYINNTFNTTATYYYDLEGNRVLIYNGRVIYTEKEIRELNRCEWWKIEP